jgi:hypothetical protein
MIRFAAASEMIILFFKIVHYTYYIKQELSLQQSESPDHDPGKLQPTLLRY